MDSSTMSVAASASDTSDAKYVFFITGFGKFRGVETNPTSIMVPRLKEFVALNTDIRSAPLKNLEILSTNILEVSTSAVDAEIHRIVDVVKDRYNKQDKYVFLHFGVASGAPDFSLERYGYNKADFRVPDEKGQQLLGTPICNEAPVTHKINSDLPISWLCDRHNSSAEECCPATESDDPGRFICNWCCYRSLTAVNRLQQEYCDSACAPCHRQFFSLFVHVPDFSVAGLDEQLFFASSLIANICKALYQTDHACWAVDAALPSNSTSTSAAVSAAKGGDVAGTSINSAAAEDATSLVLAELLSFGFEEEMCIRSLEHMPPSGDWRAQAAAAAEWIVNTLAAPAAGVVPAFTVTAQPTHPIIRDYKMVVVVRADLEMGRGKVAAQACHGALKAVRKMMMDAKGADIVRRWESQGEPIVVVKCDDKAHMDALSTSAQAVGLPWAVIRDAGRTQVDPGTATVLAIGPAEIMKVNEITGSLKLL